jgi:hypothetical protein
MSVEHLKKKRVVGTDFLQTCSVGQARKDKINCNFSPSNIFGALTNDHELLIPIVLNAESCSEGLILIVGHFAGTTLVGRITGRNQHQPNFYTFRQLTNYCRFRDSDSSDALRLTISLSHLNFEHIGTINIFLSAIVEALKMPTLQNNG